MRYAILGKTGLSVSRITYGGIVSMNDGQEASDKYVAWAVERGVNYFDVAPTYGDAQEKLGNSLKPYRKDIYLAAKTEKRRAGEAREALENSLRLLHTDVLDVYQMHALTTQEDFDQAFGPGGVLEVMVKAREEGLVRKLGITAHNEEIALKAMEAFEFDTVLYPVNWRMSMSVGMGDRVAKAAGEKGMGLLALKAFVERAWEDGEERTYPKAWCKPIDPAEGDFLRAAMRYSLAMGCHTLVPPGDFEHFEFGVENIDACVDEPISGAERALLAEKLKTGRNFF